jgi:hypothetical protein
LDVTATFRSPLGASLEIEPGAEKFLEGLGVRQGDVYVPSKWGEPRIVPMCARGCDIHYRFRLSDAARELADVDLAMAAGGALFAPPSTWLVHPVSLPENGRYRFHVTVPPGVRFATGVRRAAGGDYNTFEASTDSFEESSFAGFGSFRGRLIHDEEVDVVIAPGLRLPDEAVMAWATRQVMAVSGYFGVDLARPSLSLFVLPGSSEVMRGKTLGGGGASVFLRVGTSVTAETLKDDWVLCHELIHAALPSPERREAWFSEGLATYLEPVIRAKSGMISEEKFWGDLVEGLPQGLPAAGDEGLENNEAWGRIYWGGALYFLLVDIAIREASSGAHSLQDGLATVAQRGNVESYEPLQEIIDAADRGAQSHAFRELYDRFARAPGTVDLPALWLRLGVVPDGKSVRFDDTAPATLLRKSMLVPSVIPRLRHSAVENLVRQ